LTLHGPDGERILGFDNSHPAPRGKSALADHQHHGSSVRPYAYSDATSLIEAFWVAVDQELRNRGLVK
jgi:hypothetical protein